MFAFKHFDRKNIYGIWIELKQFNRPFHSSQKKSQINYYRKISFFCFSFKVFAKIFRPVRNESSIFMKCISFCMNVCAFMYVSILSFLALLFALVISFHAINYFPRKSPKNVYLR